MALCILVLADLSTDLLVFLTLFAVLRCKLEILCVSMMKSLMQCNAESLSMR